MTPTHLAAPAPTVGAAPPAPGAEFKASTPGRGPEATAAVPGPDRPGHAPIGAGATSGAPAPEQPAAPAPALAAASRTTRPPRDLPPHPDPTVTRWVPPLAASARSTATRPTAQREWTAGGNARQPPATPAAAAPHTPAEPPPALAPRRSQTQSREAGLTRAEARSARRRVTPAPDALEITVEIGAIEIVEDVATTARPARRPPVSLGDYLRSRGGP